MNELPIKLQVKILSFLPLIELIRLRTISKSWKLLIDVSTKKKELILFVDTEKLPLKWEYNKQTVNKDNCLIVKKNYPLNHHFINFFKYVERLFIFDPTSAFYSINDLIYSLSEIKHLQIIINFKSTELDKVEFYQTIDFGGHRLETFSFNSLIKHNTTNYLKYFDLKATKLNFLSIDLSLKNGPNDLFKTLKYLKIQEIDLEYQQKLKFDNLEILVCLKPFIILLKNMPKLKQIHLPYFYVDVVKYSNCLKQTESKLGVEEIGKFSKIDFYFSGFKCRTHDYLGSIFRAYMLNLKPIAYYDTINYEVLKLMINRTMEIDFSNEANEFIYTDEFGDQIVNLDDYLIHQLTLNRNRLVRFSHKIDNTEHLLMSTILFRNVERIIINAQLKHEQLSILPDIFTNLHQFEQEAKFEFCFTIDFGFLAEFKCLRKFILKEFLINKESIEKILFNNKSNVFRIAEFNTFLLELNNNTVQFRRKRSTNHNFHNQPYYYFSRISENKKYDSRTQFKKDIFYEIDRYIKWDSEQSNFPLGIAQMVREN